MPPPNKKRKTSSTAPAEIKFDVAAREEYLTGFHKRKQARIKHAQEEAARKEKEERQRLRREMRQKRKEDLEKHVSEVNTLLRKANPDLSDPDKTESGKDEGEEEFQGFDEFIEDINREDEYIDEDKYTTVTIESVGISKEGFEKAQDGDAENEEGRENGTENMNGEDGTKKRIWTKERPKADRPKKKKKQFRYETKAERKAERIKQGLKKKVKAQARK
ncbi:hypothetical protein CC78DRAFT_418802, partial [Lojkania enalia]